MKMCINCLWNDQCGELCGCGDSCEICSCECDNYTPVDEDQVAFTYYRQVLAEAAAEYNEVIEEYSDGIGGDYNG